MYWQIETRSIYIMAIFNHHICFLLQVHFYVFYFWWKVSSILKFTQLGGVSNCWNQMWNGMTEWKNGMEYEMEQWVYTVTANLCNWCCSIQVELPTTSPGSYLCNSEVDINASTSMHGAVARISSGTYLAFWWSCKTRLSHKKWESGFISL